MAPKVEARPFLSGYTDDPASEEAYHHNHDGPAGARQAARGHRLARDLLVFFLASLLWLAAIFFLLPWPTTTSTSTSTSTSMATSGGGAAAAGVGGGQMTAKVDYRVHNLTSGSKFVSCGSSAAEARRAGCRYDMLLNHWVPARCADQEWIDEYQDDDSWTAFADEELTQKISLDDMGARDHYYTSIRDHVNHCAMLWRKQFWTLFEDRSAFDGVIVNGYHTEHCAQFLSDLMTMNRTTPTLVRVGYTGCWVREDGAEL